MPTPMSEIARTGPSRTGQKDGIIRAIHRQERHNRAQGQGFALHQSLLTCMSHGSIACNQLCEHAESLTVLGNTRYRSLRPPKCYANALTLVKGYLGNRYLQFIILIIKDFNDRVAGTVILL